MPKTSSESVVDRFIKAARNYAVAKQQLEEAKATGKLSASDKFQIDLLKPGLNDGVPTPTKTMNQS